MGMHEIAETNERRDRPNTGAGIPVNRVALLNTGTGRAAVTFGTTSSNMDTPAIASTGNAGSLVLPANMIYPMIIDCGAPDLYIKGISSGTNTLYITLVATE